VPPIFLGLKGCHDPQKVEKHCFRQLKRVKNFDKHGKSDLKKFYCTWKTEDERK